MKDFLTRVWRTAERFFDWYTGGRRRRVYDIGPPADYALGIDNRWRDRYGFWVVRNHQGIFVLTAGEPEPWAWPVVRLSVWLDAAGHLQVDTRRKLRYELGEWSDPSSCVRLSEEGSADAGSARAWHSVGG